MNVIFKQPSPIPEGWYFPEPGIFSGEYGRILELLWCGCIVGLGIAIIIILVVDCRHR